MGQNRGRRPATALLLVALALAPAGVRAETLSDALVTAVKTSPDLSSARANVKILAERAVQARSQGRIQINGTVNVTASFLDLNRFTYPDTMQLDVEQPLYTGGQVVNATEAALTRMTAQEARVIATEEQVLLDAATAYLDVRHDQTLVDLAENNVNLIGEQLRAAEARFNVGEVTRTDVAQAQSRQAAARSTLAARRGALKASRETYKRVVGDYPLDLQPPPPIPDLPDSLEQAVQIALQEDPQIHAARLERIAAGSDVRAAIGALLPQISILGRASHSDFLAGDAGPRTNVNSDASLGLQIRLPFYNGGFNYSRVREAEATVEARAADVTTSMRQSVEQVGTAWADLQVARASIQAGQLEVKAAQIAFEGVREEAKVGARTTLDVLNAEQELLNSRGDLVVARRDEYVAAFQLLFAMGKLTVEHLGLQMGEVATASAYYASVKDRNFGYDSTDDTVWTQTFRP